MKLRVGAAGWVSRLCRGLVIVIPVGLMFSAHPQSDDLWRGGLTREFGLWGAMKFEWEAWCGRWLLPGAAPLTLTSVGIPGEYLGRIYDEVKRRARSTAEAS